MQRFASSPLEAEAGSLEGSLGKSYSERLEEAMATCAINNGTLSKQGRRDEIPHGTLGFPFAECMTKMGDSSGIVLKVQFGMMSKVNGKRIRM